MKVARIGRHRWLEQRRNGYTPRGASHKTKGTSRVYWQRRDYGREGKARAEGTLVVRIPVGVRKWNHQENKKRTPLTIVSSFVGRGRLRAAQERDGGTDKSTI